MSNNWQLPSPTINAVVKDFVRSTADKFLAAKFCGVQAHSIAQRAARMGIKVNKHSASIWPGNEAVSHYLTTNSLFVPPPPLSEYQKNFIKIYMLQMDVRQLANRCGADADVVADYILALQPKQKPVPKKGIATHTKMVQVNAKTWVEVKEGQSIDNAVQWALNAIKNGYKGHDFAMANSMVNR
jgi:hypothetical protein